MKSPEGINSDNQLPDEIRLYPHLRLRVFKLPEAELTQDPSSATRAQFITTNHGDLFEFIGQHPDCDIDYRQFRDSAGRRQLYAVAVPSSVEE